MSQTVSEMLAARSTLARCAAAANEQFDRIAKDLRKGLLPADCDFVAFGSLARKEWTTGSDVDWTLLVDGRADPKHASIAREIRAVLEKLGFKRPGTTGSFGGLTFSHDLIHQIGGQEDSNLNTTRRILLLLESVGVDDQEAGVRTRVLRQLLRRYLDEDQGYHARHAFKVRVPRFLLNDIVRYWRTMAVDYAAKRRDRGGDGWALRNFKLRVSRKLTFAAGLAMCLTCELREEEACQGFPDDGTAEEFYSALAEFLMRFINSPPLEILVDFAHREGNTQARDALLDTYERFLALLDAPAKRKALEQLGVDETVDDAVFGEARAIGDAFQEGLSSLFFDTRAELTSLTQRYGVF